MKPESPIEPAHANEGRPRSRDPLRRYLGWAIAWLILLVVVAALLVHQRRAVMARLGTPRALAQWRAWQAQTQRQARQSGPVARRPIKSDEPPSLILMRDHFAAVLATTMLVVTLLFAFLAFVGRGMAAGRVERTDPP